MSSAKTITTELSVGFGILGIDAPTISGINLVSCFDNTLTDHTYRNIFIPEYVRTPEIYGQFVQCGLNLRHKRLGMIKTVRWTGGEQQASTVLIAADIFIPTVNTPISVKFNSNVVANPSPYNLFHSLPSGMLVSSQAGDWYIEKNYSGIQVLYDFVRSIYPHPIPFDIRDYYKETTRKARRPFQRFIDTLQDAEYNTFNDLYKNMCIGVAQISADEFNRNLDNVPSNMRPAVMEQIVKYLTRINAVPYYLTGIDNNHPFAVRIPDLTTWRRTWSVSSIRAEPAIGRGQAVVNLRVDFQNKNTRDHVVMPYHVEVRWSHGKFCGNPEGKLYKEFHWGDVPFFESVFSG